MMVMVKVMVLIVKCYPVRPHSLVVRVSGHTASGSYKCEVSVEKSFYTLSSSKNLTVVGNCRLVIYSTICVFGQFELFSVPPLSAPIITGGREFYSEVSPSTESQFNSPQQKSLKVQTFGQFSGNF